MIPARRSGILSRMKTFGLAGGEIQSSYFNLYVFFAMFITLKVSVIEIQSSYSNYEIKISSYLSEVSVIEIQSSYSNC